MDSERLGKFHGLWATEPEISEGMLRVTEMDEVPVRTGDTREGMVLRTRGTSSLVFEVLLADAARDRFYLVLV